MTQQELLRDVQSCPVCNKDMWAGAPHCLNCGWINKNLPSKKRSFNLVESSRSVYRYIFGAEKGKMSPADQLAMYIGLVIGVLLSAHLRGTRESTVVFACAVALVIAPISYEKLKVAPESPFIAKFGLFVQSGVFWDILFEAIGSKLAGGG
ncbi:MAG: hypothetical protein AAGD25_29295 [Cyanobacteria bacterium P01_F01_bin.150]